MPKQTLTNATGAEVLGVLEACDHLIACARAFNTIARISPLWPKDQDRRDISSDGISLKRLLVLKGIAPSMIGPILGLKAQTSTTWEDIAAISFSIDPRIFGGFARLLDKDIVVCREHGMMDEDSGFPLLYRVGRSGEILEEFRKFRYVPMTKNPNGLAFLQVGPLSQERKG